jgi:hypothetical protein
MMWTPFLHIDRAMPKALDFALWSEIRRRWEYDPDAPSFTLAASRAASAHGFQAPGRSAVHSRAHREGWERKGSMEGVNASANLRADALVDADGAKKAAIESALNAQTAFEASADARAAVLARHRQELAAVAGLVTEALACRAQDPVGAFNRAKLAKISVEATAIRQAAERKAWSLDIAEAPDIDVSKLTDTELDSLVRGKWPKSIR